MPKFPRNAQLTGQMDDMMPTQFGAPTGPMMGQTGFGAPTGPMMGPAGFGGPGPAGPGFPGAGPGVAAPVGPGMSFTDTLPPVVSPTQQFVNTNQFTHIVPHIHPSHTTTVNKHKYVHEHYCPHTQSVVNEVSHQHVNCCCPPGMMGPGPRRPF